MAQIYDERLGRPEDAVAAYKKVLELDPGSERALKALDDLFTRQKMWAELAENLEAQLALAADDEAQLALMLRLAALREGEMGLVDVAIEGYRQVLERSPTDAAGPCGARAPRQGRRSTSSRSPICSSRSTATLATGRSSSASTRCRFVAARTSTRRVELLHQIAQLYEDSAADLGSAFATLARALRKIRRTRRRSSSSIALPAPRVASTTWRASSRSSPRRSTIRRTRAPST